MPFNPSPCALHRQYCRLPQHLPPSGYYTTSPPSLSSLQLKPRPPPHPTPAPPRPRLFIRAAGERAQAGSCQAGVKLARTCIATSQDRARLRRRAPWFAADPPPLARVLKPPSLPVSPCYLAMNAFEMHRDAALRRRRPCPSRRRRTRRTLKLKDWTVPRPRSTTPVSAPVCPPALPVCPPASPSLPPLSLSQLCLPLVQPHLPGLLLWVCCKAARRCRSPRRRVLQRNPTQPSQLISTPPAPNRRACPPSVCCAQTRHSPCRPSVVPPPVLIGCSNCPRSARLDTARRRA